MSIVVSIKESVLVTVSLVISSVTSLVQLVRKAKDQKEQNEAHHRARVRSFTCSHGRVRDGVQPTIDFMSLALKTPDALVDVSHQVISYAVGIDGHCAK
eukprot:CAMPEP_0168343200 /NCGR_PEP_ID=MMETSP0213-20121227/15912_1 /TAXON_ID=151035 /ORGANISM="Euplotes harpa, Strain FSP1.4" /LENGTH=98 /DNA_ID=CAMNT_0008350371 /DNA_START=133 /DNA_END=426 /DNA_ORIENTATION=-